MAKEVKQPKRVKRAGQWVVTVVNGDKQEQHWFSNQDDADKFFAEVINAG